MKAQNCAFRKTEISAMILDMEYMDRIGRYCPQTKEEAETQQELFAAFARRGNAVLEREEDHVTVSAVVLDPTLTYILLIDHTLFQSLAWPGGHADGEPDLTSVALRETLEETGLSAWLLTEEILSLDTLEVKAHQRKGQEVLPHRHYSVAYGLLAPMHAPKADGREATSACWVEIERLEKVCREVHMVPIYQKIIDRMRTIAQEKQKVYGQLPELLLPWYAENARDLPWRRDREPYHVWLSEIMLQQTRVEAVKKYYTRFLQELPTVEALAKVSEERLFRLWEGLGYYRRARNLQKTAKLLWETNDGVFPQTYDELLTLPGIGEYTAGAIASICMEQPTPAVDGNVLRVLARVTEDYACVDLPRQKQVFTEALRKVYPKGRCGAFTQALMELGATVCLPNGTPACDACPLQAICRAHRQGTETKLPTRMPKKARRKERYTVFLLRCQDRIAVQKREEGLLADMWQLPNCKGELTAQQAMDCVARWGMQPTALVRTMHRTHVFTHVEWEMTCHEILCLQTEGKAVWVTPQQREAGYALPTAFRQFLER